MNQAIQDIAPADADTIARVEGSIGHSFMRPQAETSMRPSGVVVVHTGDANVDRIACPWLAAGSSIPMRTSCSSLAARCSRSPNAKGPTPSSRGS